ncbi:hypothetical protein HERIO_516 [Hepatospora eriocheir]|uniref:Uncharacterized protein n=1 Tax=Hepatospora eriocheir TaxID=1081669 RepID=A0A1X0QCU5_9MICR|nr:hypothetical protein HERIO_516 [Hepatospora eriocheir]
MAEKKKQSNQTLALCEIKPMLPQVMINALINDLDNSFTIDTESVESILSRTNTQKLMLKITKNEKIHNIQVANGEFIKLSEKPVGKMRFYEYTKAEYDVEFLIAEKFVNNTILRIKFLEKYNVNIILSERYLQFPTFNVNLTTPTTSLSLPDLELSDKVKCMLTQQDVVIDMINEFVEHSPELEEINNFEHSIILKPSAVFTSKPYSIPMALVEQFKDKLKTS